MIQKILISEYAPRLSGMTAAEKSEYLDRAGEWLQTQAPLLLKKTADDAARFQNVLQASAAWNDKECKAWSDGAAMLTALVGASDTWLPDMLYVKAVRRSIRQMVAVIRDTVGGRTAGTSAVRQEAKAPAKDVVGKAAKDQEVEHGGTEKEVSAEGTVTAAQTVPVQPLPSGGSPVPERPKHIDQYVHLLPRKTQEHAALVRGYLRDLDVARENARRLMDAGEHPDKIAVWAKAAAKFDSQIRAIYQELDMEWGKLVASGKVTVDALGNAHVVAEKPEDKREQPDAARPEKHESVQPQEQQPAKRPGRPPMTEEEKAAKAAEREAKKKAENLRKAALIRKWLIDKRNAVSDEQKEKWTARYLEMVALGGEGTVTDKVREAAEYYGVDIMTSRESTNEQ